MLQKILDDMRVRYAASFWATAALGWLVVIQRPEYSAVYNTAVTAATITALLASLLVKFSAYAKSEGWQKWVVLYLPMTLLGFLMGVALRAGDIMSCVQLGISTLIHAAFWLASCESRADRKEKFFRGPGRLMESFKDVFFLLEMRGFGDVADDIIKVFGSGRDVVKPTDKAKTVNYSRVTKILADVDKLLLDSAKMEIVQALKKLYGDNAPEVV